MDAATRLSNRIKDLLPALETVVVAIDGPCGGGKSTLAAAVSHRFPDSFVIHVDDFFLQPHQRTALRLAAPGGNLDRERLKQTVLDHLRTGSAFPAERFDCQSGEMLPFQVPSAKLYIVEGSYSLHPDLRSAYDLKVFLDATRKTQLERLRNRVKDDRLQDFVEKWIPLEDAYFDCCKVREAADLIL